MRRVRRCPSAARPLAWSAAARPTRRPCRIPRTSRPRATRSRREGEWGRAAERYRLAFAVEDPLPERAKARALARLPPRPRAGARAAGRGRRALVRPRLASRPGLYVVHFERGLLHDGRHPETTDRKTARAAFERFLAESERAGSPPADAGVAAEARTALEALGD